MFKDCTGMQLMLSRIFTNSGIGLTSEVPFSSSLTQCRVTNSKNVHSTVHSKSGGWWTNMSNLTTDYMLFDY